MTMCELRRKIAALGLTGPITLVLDNARRHPAFAEFRAAIEHTLAGLSTHPRRPGGRAHDPQFSAI